MISAFARKTEDAIRIESATVFMAHVFKVNNLSLSDIVRAYRMEQPERFE
jgi:hypothetical protein